MLLRLLGSAESYCSFPQLRTTLRGAQHRRQTTCCTCASSFFSITARPSAAVDRPSHLALHSHRRLTTCWTCASDLSCGLWPSRTDTRCARDLAAARHGWDQLPLVSGCCGSDRRARCCACPALHSLLRSSRNMARPSRCLSLAVLWCAGEGSLEDCKAASAGTHWRPSLLRALFSMPAVPWRAGAQHRGPQSSVLWRGAAAAGGARGRAGERGQ